MPIPKSQKLLREMTESKLDLPGEIPDETPNDTSSEPIGPILIREVPCCNEFVAILPFRIKAGVLVPDAQYKNEGIIIGVGPGLPTTNGGRCPSQLKIGDVVAFQHQTVVLKMESNKPPYQGRQVYIMSERNILCKLPPVPFKLSDN